MKIILAVYAVGLICGFLSVWFLKSPAGTIAACIFAGITAVCMLYVSMRSRRI